MLAYMWDLFVLVFAATMCCTVLGGILMTLFDKWGGNDINFK